MLFFVAHSSFAPCYKHREAWNCNATSYIGGPEKTLVYRCSNSSPRYSVRTPMPFSYTI